MATRQRNTSGVSRLRSKVSGIFGRRDATNTFYHVSGKTDESTPSSTTQSSAPSFDVKDLQTALPPVPHNPAVLQSRQDPELNEFLVKFPYYSATWVIDELRQSSYARLGDQTYVDFMGGCIMPDTLVQWHSSFLQSHVLGNTHSISRSSQVSSRYAEDARSSTLRFFDAPEDEYTVVFTPNATAALKLVGECYPFGNGANLILPVDAHNSCHGMRRFATDAGAEVHYLRSLKQGGIDIGATQSFLSSHGSSQEHPSLYVITGQSNITNSKTPLSICQYASSLGYATLLDAAALAPTTRISLRKSGGVDAMAVSFYKMFGYPTGVGALIVKKSFLDRLSKSKPWFAGGNVDVVQVPGNIVTLAHEVHERFEDGTINYSALPAIARGLSFLDPLLTVLPQRLYALTRHLTDALSNLRYPGGQKAVSVISRTYEDTHKEKDVTSQIGSLISMVFLDSRHEILPLSFVSYCALEHNVSLRTGCVCNPGGAAAMLGIEYYMERLSEGANLRELEASVGRELGVVRVSLGLASNFQDVHRVIEFAKFMANEEKRDRLKAEWRGRQARG